MRNEPSPVVVAATVRLRLQILVAKISFLGKVRVVEREKPSTRPFRRVQRNPQGVWVWGQDASLWLVNIPLHHLTTSPHAVSLTFCPVYVETWFKHFVHQAFLSMSMSESCSFSKGGGGGALWMSLVLQLIWFVAFEIQIRFTRGGVLVYLQWLIIALSVV